MKRIYFLVLIFTLFVTACNHSTVDDETARKYIEESEKAIHFLNEFDHEGLIQMFNRDLRVGVTVERLKNLDPLIEQSGRFIEIERTSVEREKDYYVAISGVKYKKEHRIITIKFDRNDDIADLLVQ